VLSDEVDCVYKCSDFYTPGDEYALRWNDPDLKINWPVENGLVSEKDQRAPRLKDVPAQNLPRC
jgi:dTDP-4-dehydrorhamnose 3,5-epimerase